MPKLLCPTCKTEVTVEFLEDIAECPNCGEMISKETAGAISYEPD
jgi:predicted RNA-binding Zn-ribbon protein involved in translation (DUF1610 family)